MAQCGKRTRAWPSSLQKMTISQWIGCSRLIYNAKVSEQEYFFRFSKASLSLTGEKIPVDQSYSQFKSEETAFLKTVPSQILRNSAYRWHQAMMRFFKGEAGKPRKKRKGARDSVWLTSELFYFDDSGRLFIGTTKYPLGELHYERHGEFKHPSSITLSKKNGEYYLSFNYENEEIKESGPEEVLKELMELSEEELLETTVGLDRGIVIPIQSSSDRKFDFTPEQKRTIERKERRIKRWQKRLSRQKLGSNRREKQKKKIGKAHQKITNVRKDFAHKTSFELAESTARLFAVEDLKIQNMTKSPEPKKKEGSDTYLPNGSRAKAGLTKKILQVGWGQIILFLTYKALRRNKLVLKVTPYPSSQECSQCGYTHPDNRRTQETFLCTVCGHSENADLNAAKVLRKRAIRQVIDQREIPRGIRDSARGGKRQTLLPKKQPAQALRSENRSGALCATAGSSGL
jgi:putative transposase